MSKIESLEERRKKKKLIETKALMKIDQDLIDKKWVLFDDIVLAIKNCWIPRKKTIKLVKFLMDFFEITPEEIKNDEVEKWEYKTHKIKSKLKYQHIITTDLLLSLRSTVKKRHLGQCVAMRIIRVAKVWYKLSILISVK